MSQESSEKVSENESLGLVGIPGNIANEKPLVVFDPDCIRKKSNWSTVRSEFKFDHPDFSPEMFLKDMPDFSPKLAALFQKMGELDARDQKKYGKTFKHFIFSDVKSGGQGAKMIAAGLSASGWKMASNAEWLNRKTYTEARRQLEQGNKKVPEPKYGPLTLLSQRELLATRKHNFLLLSSVGVFDKPIGVQMKKSMLALFNSRPENIYGDLARVIIMDSGFKEGIDLFDIKYVHIFEPPMSAADQKQVIGRGTRTCGQKGLVFHPMQGWPLDVFVYDLEIPEKLRFSMLGADSAHDLWMKAMKMDVRLANFEYDMERLAVVGSVDFELNKAVHNFQVDLLEADADADRIVLGGTKQSLKRPMDTFGHDEMVKYIRDNFSNFKWENVKMENLCGDVPAEWENWEPKGSESPIISELTEEDSEVPMLSSLSQSSASSASSAASQASQASKRTTETATIGESPKSASDTRTLTATLMDSRAKTPVLTERSPSKATTLTVSLLDSPKARTKGASQATTETEVKRGGASSVLQFNPTQGFIRGYFSPAAPVKGMLLYHSTGSGKTCSAIAAATANFEPLGYTILWVTRTTLKNDIWKNMFDQVCHKGIQDRITQGENIPDVQKERMRLLSKAWRIRPMSYKQFSNLVSKKNKYYEELVKENGEADPLQRTLLIIDEAHKLYGGTDLSSLERPDMAALHQALMNSYAISGENSVRLLLMTATPITKHPLELVQLVNLCRPNHLQIPATFEQFGAEYLTEEGIFTPLGQDRFLDQIAGHISYLNREKDARQFSQPRIKRVMVPILSDAQMTHVDDFDKFVSRSQAENDIMVIQDRLEKTAEKIENELRHISKEDFQSFFKLCDNYENISEKKCQAVIKKNVVALIRDVKAYTKTLKDQLKIIRKELSEMKKGKQLKIMVIAKKIKENPILFEQYKASTYAAIRNKCSSKTLEGTKFLEAVEALPEVLEINQKIQGNKEAIAMMEAQLETELHYYKQKVKELKESLKNPNIAPMEKTAIEYMIRKFQTGFRTAKKNRSGEVQKEVKRITEKIQENQKTKRALFQKIRKTLKKREREAKKEEKKAAQDLLKLMKIPKEIHDEDVKEMAERRKGLIEYDLNELQKEIHEKEREQQKKKEEKEEEREHTRREKQHAKTLKEREQKEEKERKNLEKQREKEEAKTRKQREKQEANTRKQREKEEAKTRKQREKEEQKKEKEALKKAAKGKK